MADALLNSNGTTQTGVVITLGAGQARAGVEIQRSLSDAGPWEDVASYASIEETGTPFIDFLPMDGVTRWYRARHVAPGYAPGPWMQPIPAKPDVIPNEDFTSKKWLRVNAALCELLMVKTGETDTTLTVAASINKTTATGGGTPVFSVVDSVNVGTVTKVNATTWTIQKPVSGQGQVTFKNSLSGFVDDLDSVTVQPIGAALLPRLSIRAEVTNTTSTTFQVSCSVSDPIGSGGITITPKVQPAGVVTVTGTNPYTISRPTGSQAAKVDFVASAANRLSDTDSVVITPVALATLTVEASLVSQTSIDATVRVKVTDPIPESPITLTCTGQNLGAALSQTFVMNSGETKDITVAKPAYGQGAGRVLFVATSLRRTSANDAQDVPEQTIESTGTGMCTTTIGTVTAGGSSVQLPYTIIAQSTAVEVDIWYQEHTGEPAISDIINVGSIPKNSPIVRKVPKSELTGVIVIPVCTPGNWILYNVVPYDMLGREGVITRGKVQALVDPAVAPNPVTAVNVSIGSTSVSNRLTMPAGNLPHRVRTYRNGVPYGSDWVVNIGAGQQVTLSHTTDILPEMTYVFEYAGVTDSGGESAKSAPITVTTPSAGLAVPAISFNGAFGDSIYFGITNIDAFPAGTAFEGTYTTKDSPTNQIPLTRLSSKVLRSDPMTFPNNGAYRIRALCANYAPSPYAGATWSVT